MKLTHIKNILAICFCFLMLLNIQAVDQGKPYSVDNIPKNLLLNANAVIRNDEMVFTIEDVDQTKVKVKHTVTILNEKASDYRFYMIPYNKFVKISNIKASVYDSKGNLLIIRPDIRDVNGNYEDLASDERYWLISVPIRQYPYTIEYEYEKTKTGSFFYDDWVFQNRPDVSVQQSGAQFLVKKGLGFRVHEENLKHACDTFSLDDKLIYTWQEENIPAIRTEELFMISFSDHVPSLLTAPNQFVMGGLHGSMESWESFGQFFYDLNKNRDNISVELQAKLKQLISNTTDKREVVKRLYQYLQQHTRYVGIQLGIGGYQTLEASFVEKKGYGDCKALTNYLKAMLKSVGILSYQTLVSSDEEDIITKFPSNQFNHVILCVPLAQDTVWLECTSQTLPFNFLGGTTSNKHVLLLTEKGGKLIKTPQYRSDGNKISSNFNVSIDIMGNAEVKGKIQFTGLAYGYPKAQLTSSKEDQEDLINDLFASPNLIINKVSYTESSSVYPVLDMECGLTVRDLVSKTKKRMVFRPYLFDPLPYLPKFTKEDFKVNNNRLTTDTVTFSLPYGYKLEFIPEPVILESGFGRYQKSFQVIQGKLLAIREFEYFDGAYEQKDIDAFTEYMNKIAESDRELVLLVKE